MAKKQASCLATKNFPLGGYLKKKVQTALKDAVQGQGCNIMNLGCKLQK